VTHLRKYEHGVTTFQLGSVP